MWSEITFVGFPEAFAREAIGLAWLAAGPEFPIIRISSQSSCVAPSTDPREEVALRVALEVIRLDIHDAPFVNIAGRDEVLCYEVAKPLSGIGIEFVVVGRHQSILP